MHCFCRKTFVFSFSVCVFCEYVPRFVKLELTLHKIPIWHGLIYIHVCKHSMAGFRGSKSIVSFQM